MAKGERDSGASGEHDSGSGSEQAMPRRQERVHRRGDKTFSFTTNDTLDAIVGKLRSEPADLESIQQRILGNPDAVSDPSNLTGTFGEEHVNAVVRNAIASGELPGKVELDQVDESIVTEHYIFRRNTRNKVHSQEIDTGKDTSEFDLEGKAYEPESETDGPKVEAKSLPFIVDVKLGGRSARGKGLKKGLVGAMKDETEARLFYPFSEVHDTNEFGHVIAAAPGVPNMEAPNEQRFVSKGGIIVELPLDMDEVKAKAEETGQLVQEQKQQRKKQ